jgi:toxin ParE1/3/4
MVSLVWTAPALSDLDAIADYIALDNEDAASRLVRRVFDHVEMLVQHPELGPRIPELRPRSRYRQLVEPPCRIFYRFDKSRDAVYILGVMRGERLFKPRKLSGRDKPGKK